MYLVQTSPVIVQSENLAGGLNSTLIYTGSTRLVLVDVVTKVDLEGVRDILYC